MITWIASYPKSGNTWVRGFLSAYLNNGKLDIQKFRFVDVDDITGYFYHIVSPRPVETLTEGQIVQLRGAALSHMATLLEYPLIKTHSINGEIDGVASIPLALTKDALYIIRDPRDVVVSLSYYLDSSLDEAIDFLNNPRQMIHKSPDFKGLFNFVGMWSQHVVTWGDEKHFRVGLVRYEDLVNNPSEGFRRILDFLDWEFDSELFEKSVLASSFESMKQQELDNGFRENRGNHLFFRNGGVGQWKNILSEDQVARIEEQNFDVIERMKYPLALM